MDLQTYISEMPRRVALALEIGSSPAYLYQIATGRRRPSTHIAHEIERATKKLGPEEVTRASLRPDVWAGPATADAMSCQEMRPDLYVDRRTRKVA